MREIKFRAWDKPTQLMDDVALIDFYNDKIGILYADPFVQGESMKKHSFNEIVLMQSTGLKDKNGVEIFEGDIINISSHTPFSNIVEFDKEGASFMLRPVYKRWSNSYFTNYEHVDKERFEIIGNIYENPELLKDEEQTGGTERKERV